MSKNKIRAIFVRGTGDNPYIYITYDQSSSYKYYNFLDLKEFLDLKNKFEKSKKLCELIEYLKNKEYIKYNKVELSL